MSPFIEFVLNQIFRQATLNGGVPKEQSDICLETHLYELYRRK